MPNRESSAVATVTAPVEPIRRKRRRRSGAGNITAEYVSDLGVDGMLYGAFIRIDAPMRRIEEITVPVMGEDCVLVTAQSNVANNAVRVNGMDIPIFAQGYARYAGECAGLVVAPTYDRAVSLVNSAVVRLGERIGQKEIDDSETVAIDKYGDDARYDEDTAQVVTVERHLSFHCHVWHERQGVICVIDKQKKLKVMVPTSHPAILRRCVARALGSDEAHITVLVTRRHGLVNEWYMAIMACQAAVAATAAGKAVFLMNSTEEESKFVQNAVMLHTKTQTYIKDGRITALQIGVEADVGAYNPYAHEVLERVIASSIGKVSAFSTYPKEVPHTFTDPRRVMHNKEFGITALYNVPISMEVHAISSCRPPTSLDANMLDAMMAISLNSVMAAIPSDGRHFIVDNARQIAPEDMIKSVIKNSDYDRKRVSFAMDKGENLHTPRRGIGFACVSKGGAFVYKRLHESPLSVSLLCDDNGALSATIDSALPPSDMVDEWKRTVSQLLEIKSMQVVITGEEESTQFGSGVVSDKAIMAYLLRQCCMEIMRKKSKGMTFPITARRKMPPSIRNSVPFYATTTGACVVEAETDAKSGRKTICHIWLALESSKDEDTREGAVRLAIEKVIFDMGCPFVVSDDITLEFVETRGRSAREDMTVYSVLPAAIDDALRQATGCSCGQ